MSQTIIYQAVNLVNGKRYIGLTEKGLLARKIKHLANARNNKTGKFYTAIRKHGPNSFHFAELTSCRDYWHGLEVERLYISLLQPEYNLTSGGGGVKGFKFSVESRAKMSAAKKGKIGHPCPEWLKQKNAELRSAERGIIGIRRTSRKSVYCITDKLFFPSGRAAATHYGVNPQQISACCRHGEIYYLKYGGRYRELAFRFADQAELQ